MKIRTGDNVKIIAGKDKGKTGKVIQAFPRLARVVVEGVGLRTRHLRGRRREEKGQKVSFASPIHASNVQLLCGKCGRLTRVAMKALTDGSKVRVCVRCKEALS